METGKRAVFISIHQNEDRWGWRGFGIFFTDCTNAVQQAKVHDLSPNIVADLWVLVGTVIVFL